jgi:hypothetical protein
MKHESSHRRVWNGEVNNLLLFPDEPSALTEASLSTNASPTSESFLPRIQPLSLMQITAEWQTLRKRLGRRRRVLETILLAGQPIRLIDNTLVIGFPPDRSFHQELLDVPDYRSCLQEELARTFRVRLSVVTASHPESRSLHRKRAFGKTPA